ncbi:MAG: hypothetical protein U5N55_03085 [Cypionkella sp.]|nr:hypothetical protein [Cypionkella sp.]
MSNPDSFIDEVTEELRRDRLFATFRKYGWIGGLTVALIVGGAAWNEYSKAQQSARAQAFGDGLIDALDLGEAGARAAALAELDATGSQSALKALIETSDNTADKPAALAALATLEADSAQPQIYRDLASLRRVMLGGADLPLQERRAALNGIAPRAFGALAREQLAYLLIEEGKKDEAIAALSALLDEQNAPAGLIARASQAIVALGGALPEKSAG